MADTEKAAPAPAKNARRQDPRVFYADMSQVAPVKHVDYNDQLARTEKRQALEGFDPEYNDILDYILKITHRIWEERGIGVIYDTYHNNITVHTSSSSRTGIKPVVAGTLETLHSYPDRRLVSENIIWAEDSPGYYFTSHRIASSATNLGDSAWGKATGKKLTFYTIADCAIHQNRIYEEWLIRDNLGMVLQMGLDPCAVARKMAAPGGDSAVLHSTFGLAESMQGQLMPENYTAADDSVGERMLEMHSRILGGKRIDLVKKYYAPGATVHFICNRDLVGTEEIQGTLISLLASFPNALHTVDRVTCNQNEDGVWDVAVRWQLRGLHEGMGMFGPPSMKTIQIMGISHYEIENGLIREERMVFDALDVMRQILAGADEAPAGIDETFCAAEAECCAPATDE